MNGDKYLLSEEERVSGCYAIVVCMVWSTREFSGSALRYTYQNVGKKWDRADYDFKTGVCLINNWSSSSRFLSYDSLWGPSPNQLSRDLEQVISLF